MIFQGGRLLRVISRLARSAERFIRAITDQRSLVPWPHIPQCSFRSKSGLNGGKGVVIAFCMGLGGLGGTAHAACGPKAGAGLGLVSPSFQLPWAKLSTALAKEGSQNGSIAGLWLVTFECDGAVWDVGFDKWRSDETDFELLKAGWRRYGSGSEAKSPPESPN